MALAPETSRFLRRILSVPLLVLGALACGDRGAGGRESTGPGAGGPAVGATLLGSDSERSGAAVYERENCARCHSQLDGPAVTGPVRLPLPQGRPVSRVGPDLGAEGHRRSDDWQYAHLYAPSAITPGSPMPASRSLFRPGAHGRPEPTVEAADLVAYLQALGRGRRDVWAEFRRSEPEVAPPPATGRALLERGTLLYAELCASCHGLSGDGCGEVAPLLAIPPRDLTAAHYRFKSTPGGEPPEDGDLYRILTLGTGLGSSMPAFYWLPPEDRWALVSRVKDFSPRLRETGLLASAARPEGPGAEGPAEQGGEAGALARGRRLWGDLGCAGCHGAEGRGMAREEGPFVWADPDGAAVPGSGDLTHACALRGGASPRAIERAIVVGVGLMMPAYGDALEGEEDRRALRAFVLALQDAPEGP